MSNLFGTDGIRGEANIYPITAEMALNIGMAIAAVFKNKTKNNTALIGKDTRLSGYMLESALQAGLISAGMNVILVGPIPSPAVAMLTTSLRASVGIMLTASHNPYTDNGIKIFDKDGVKINDHDQMAISKIVQSKTLEVVSGEALGKAHRLNDALGRYIQFVKNTVNNCDLSDMKVVVDCANGAAYNIAPRVLEELGSDAIPLHVCPNGFNINRNCGSEYIGSLSEAVRYTKSDIGIAFDGDADRVVICDEKGMKISGDQVLAAFVKYYTETEKMKSEYVVTTNIASMSLEKYVQSLGKKLIRTDVGDRNIVHAMMKYNSNLGGEPAGHFILSDYIKTGDGVIAALQILLMVKYFGKKVSQLFYNFEPVPCIVHNEYNVSYEKMQDNDIVSSINRAESVLSDMGGRILVRKSGTEKNCLRLMIECSNKSVAEGLLDEILYSIRNMHVA